MKRILPALILIIAVFTYRHQINILGATDSLTASEIISISNALRQTNKLPPLQPQEQLTLAAEAKARAMVAANAWSHNTPSNTPWDFIDKQGYVYIIAGENLAKGFISPEDVVDSWMKSPSHRDNLLNPEYTHTGVAVVVGEYQDAPTNTLVVQYLAKPYNLTTANGKIDSQFIPDKIITEAVKKTNPLAAMIIFLIFSLSSAAIWLLVRVHKLSKKSYSLPTSKHWKSR